MLFLNEADVRRLLTMDVALELLDRAFVSLARGTAFNQPRRRVNVPQGATLHMMAAGDAATGYLASKIYCTSRHGAHFTVLLYRCDTGEPLANIEADYLGQVRTGAASGIATRYMSRDDASVLAVIGAGKQAATQVQAVVRVRRLSEIRVFSRDASRREQFAHWCALETGVASRAVASASEAVAGAHVIVTATSSREPVVLGDWLEGGMHINAIGSNMANRRELDSAAVARCGRIVTDSIDQARMESGELIAAFADQPDAWSRVAELSRVVSREVSGRGSANEITLFKSNGIALEDVAVAGWLYEKMV